MSTTGITSWAVDLNDVGAIHPFQGTEVVLVIVGVAAWLAWHVWCMRWEKQYQQDKIRQYGDEKSLKAAVDSE